VTGCNFLAYSCAAARDSHPLPSSSVLTRVARTMAIGKNKTEQDANLLVSRGQSQRVCHSVQGPEGVKYQS
jgi:hypothetical protein